MKKGYYIIIRKRLGNLGFKYFWSYFIPTYYIVFNKTINV